VQTRERPRRRVMRHSRQASSHSRPLPAGDSMIPTYLIAAELLVCWTPPGPGLVLLLCWPQRPRSAVAPALRTRPCHTGTRARPRLSTPAIFHPMPTAARRPAAAGYRWPAVHPVTPSARPGMTHREERGPCADGLKAPITLPNIYISPRVAVVALSSTDQPVRGGLSAIRYRRSRAAPPRFLPWRSWDATVPLGDPGAGRVVCHGRAVRMSPGLVMASTGGNPGPPRCWTYEPGFIPGRD